MTSLCCDCIGLPFFNSEFQTTWSPLLPSPRQIPKCSKYLYCPRLEKRGYWKVIAGFDGSLVEPGIGYSVWYLLTELKFHSGPILHVFNADIYLLVKLPDTKWRRPINS